MTIAFGICIFLYAISVLEKSFASFTLIENFLKKATDKRYKSFSFGFVTTCLMQSSGLVSILAISFLSAGLITLSAGLALIFGVNLGTIAGAWLIAGVGIKTDIEAVLAEYVPVGVDVKAEWSDAEQTAINITTTSLLSISLCPHSYPERLAFLSPIDRGRN